jgi:importin subunit beta-1
VFLTLQFRALTLAQDGAALQSHSNKILTAVVSAMRKEVVNPQMRKTGVTAFYNALEFVRPNFERKEDRDYMMGVVCEGTMAKEKDLRVAFYECLVKIAQTYYEFLPTYMPDIFNVRYVPASSCY